MTMYEQESVHDAVGAYVLGILDDADASAFEAHLAGCDICAGNLEEFSGMEPMLAMLAEAPAPPMPMPQSNVVNLPGMRGMTDVPGLRGKSGIGGGYDSPRSIPVVPSAPSPRLLGGLLDEVAAKRAAKRRRGMYLIAAAAALIIGGPSAAIVFTADDDKPTVGLPRSSSPAEDAFLSGMEVVAKATDAKTEVSASVGMEKKPYGTHTVLELKNVKGPLKCNLIAVSTTGEEEVVTSWAVPKWGYGIPDSTVETAKKPLYVHGGAAMAMNEIDHFEVRTFDGKVLVEVDA
jgi:anti-sigma factor RsiW